MASAGRFALAIACWRPTTGQANADLARVAGKAEPVGHDAAAHEKLFDLVEEARATEAIRQGLADRDAGRTISLDEFKEHARQQHGISI